MTNIIPHIFTAPVDRTECIWCKSGVKSAIHDIDTVFAVQAALDIAREEGRQEVRDEIIEHMDIYAPHAVDWWKVFNAIIKFDPKGR